MRTLALLALATSFSLPAAAVVVTPGSVVAVSGTTVALRPELAGVVLADALRPFSIATMYGTLSGDVQDRVVRSDLDQTLHFYTRILNVGLSSNRNVIDCDDDCAPAPQVYVSGFGRASFEGFSTDMDWRIDGLPVADPFAAPVSATRSNPGSTAGFYFTNNSFVGQYGPQPGIESKFAFIATNATRYDANGTMNLYWYDGQQYHYGDVTGVFQPTAVPEPGTVALMLGGLALLVARRRALR